MAALKIIVRTVIFGTLLLLGAIGYFFFLNPSPEINLMGERSGGLCTDTPQFNEYPALEADVYIPSLAVDFESRPEARMFKTAIEEWFAKGVQAGRYYTVAEWGCGTACQDHAIIDQRNGKITAFGLPGSDGMMYRPDSNLIIVNPPWNIENMPSRPATVTALFYELRAGVPKLICSKPYPPIIK